jgi:hypothetical protein
MGLLYHWNAHNVASAVMGPQYGMAFVDPTPIATHVVSAEALEGQRSVHMMELLLCNNYIAEQLNGITFVRKVVEFNLSTMFINIALML